MSGTKEKQRLPSPNGASCSICLEAVESAAGKRSVAMLKCGHLFHLDCIGSAFNAKGAMQCPNCRQVEGGQWLYFSGSLMQQEDLVRNNYTRIQPDAAYLSNERSEERLDDRWSSRLNGHYFRSREEEDSLINSYPYLAADERQYQGLPRYQTGGSYMPSMELVRHVAAAGEMARGSAHLIEAERLLHRDLRPSRASAIYMQSLHPMMPRSYELSNLNMLPEFYPSHMLERPGYRRWMNDGAYEEHSMYQWPVEQRRSTHRGPSDTGIAFNPTHMHMLPEFGLQGHMSSLEQSNINRIEATRYGHFARRVGSYPSMF